MLADLTFGKQVTHTFNTTRASMVRYDSQYDITKAWLDKFPGNNRDNFRLNNPRVLRISEAYLIAAEGALKGSAGAGVASPYLNAIRKRANPAAVDVIATDNLIQEERRKEFIGEGHRLTHTTEKVCTNTYYKE